MSPARAATLSWRVRDRAGATCVELSGDIDESAAFDALARRLANAGDLVILDLAEVRRVDLPGGRAFAAFIAALPAAASVALIRCSPPVVAELGRRAGLRGRAELRSLLAPYACATCATEEERLLDVAALGADRALPDFPCRCGGHLQLDDLRERYLAILP